MELKKTALHDLHIEIGAKMVPFAGFNMPVRYTSDIEEHNTVRNAVGVFDVSHMGEFMVKGAGALDLIQKVTSNDASKLYDGKVQYSCLPNEQGGIVDDLLVYRFSEEEYMLVVNASNIEKDWNWISKHTTEGVELEDISDSMSLFAVQGPLAINVLQSLTEVPLGEMEYYTFKVGTLAGVPDVIISATGYTGSGGFELYLKNEYAVQVWKKIFEAGAPYGIKPIGLGARDTLRLEMGFCLYGNDIDDVTSPLEAGLGWITKLNKEFTGASLISRLKDNGVSKKLTAFVMQDKGIPRSHYAILNEEGVRIGEVTSGTQSPYLNQGIGMGYIASEYTKPDTEIFIEVRNKSLRAKVVRLPFYNPAKATGN